MMPHLTVKSLQSEPLPAMFPRAHTAWSTTFRCSEDNSRTKCGTAPGGMEWRREMEWNGDNIIPLETASLATAHRVLEWAGNACITQQTAGEVGFRT